MTALQVQWQVSPTDTGLSEFNFLAHFSYVYLSYGQNKFLEQASTFQLLFMRIRGAS
jgi:hypothetical protein